MIFNITRESINALEADFDFNSKRVKLRKSFSFETPVGVEFQSEEVFALVEKILRGAKKTASLIFLFEKPFVKSTLSNFSIIRERPLNYIDEDELENIVESLAWRLYDRERPIVSRLLGVAELEIFLVSSKIKDPKIDGRKIINPLGFSGKLLGFTFENTYTHRDFWDKFIKIFNRHKGEMIILAENQLIFDKVFSLVEESGILIEIGREKTKVGLLGNFLKNFEIFDWGEENLTRLIAKNLLIPLETARVLKTKYEARDLSSHSFRWFEKLLMPELKILTEGIYLAIKNFDSGDLTPQTLYLSGSLNRFPKLLEVFNGYSWPKSLFKKKPSVAIYQKEKIFDKINIRVENLEQFDHSIPLALVGAIAASFLPESSYPELNKVLKRRVKWLS